MAGPAYRVVSDRLVLRCWEPRDAAAMIEAITASLPELRAQMPWAANEPQSLADKTALLRRFRARFDLDEDYAYGIFDRDETRVLGGIGLHKRVGQGAREIGYWIHSAHTGRGLATEAASALTRVGFEVDGVERMEIHCGPHNRRSAAVANKCGYTHEATLRGRNHDVRGQPRDTMIWSLFADQYPRSSAAARALAAFDVSGARLI